MGVCFSDEVEQALRYIYYDLRAGKGKEGFALLEKASAAGDGDASCILGRCYCGPQYVWGGHGFPEDDHLAVKLMHQSGQRAGRAGFHADGRADPLCGKEDALCQHSGGI